MRFSVFLLLLLSGPVFGQTGSPTTDCGIAGSTTLFDYRQKKWIVTNEADSRLETPPASTFKVINLLIALETGVIRDEKDGRTVRSKTGWGMIDGKDIGWWIGYVEKNGNTCFFATRLTKLRTDKNPDFSRCRKDVTRKILGEHGF